MAEKKAFVSIFAKKGHELRYMTKQEHIEYWKNTAARDWITVQHLFKSKDYVPALFFAHLVLEKLCKAHWVKDNKSNHPPKIHNLARLAEQAKLDLQEEDLRFLNEMNQFQIEGRYPDYKQMLFRSYKARKTNAVLQQVNRLRKCLLKKLQ